MKYAGHFPFLKKLIGTIQLINVLPSGITNKNLNSQIKRVFPATCDVVMTTFIQNISNNKTPSFQLFLTSRHLIENEE
jgi:hypothetical protein